MLGVLGLSDLEEAVYRSLIGVLSATVDDIANAIDATISQISAALYNLGQRGLIYPLEGFPRTYSAVAPSIGLKTAIIAHEKGLRDLELEMIKLEVMHRGSGSSGQLDGVEYLPHPSAVARNTVQLVNAARSEVTTMVKRAPPVTTATDNRRVADGAALARGVRYRNLYESNSLLCVAVHRCAEALAGLGADARVRSDLPHELVVIDRSVAVVPVSDLDSAGSVVIRNEVWLSSVYASFDILWESAYPFRLETAPHDVLSALEQRVLTLLIAGLTDRAIGAQLNLSERSVQRYVARLMERANARSRVQLGWHAANHGWLDGPARTTSPSAHGA